MNTLHFLRPEWFLALPLLLVLIFRQARRHLRGNGWETVCDPELLPHLLLGETTPARRWPFWCLLLAVVLAVLALAGPAWQKKSQPLYREQSALVILLDLSQSMQANDLMPSRFLQARFKMEDLLRLRREGQTALIAFAADAFTVTPLTEDRHTIENLLKSIDPAIMPAQGSRPDRAIKAGLALLVQARVRTGRLVLVTDEDRPDLFLEAAAEVNQHGFSLDVLGVGTAQGASIPLAEGGTLTDDLGNRVIAKLDQSGLARLAAAGGGHFFDLSTGDQDIEQLLAGLEDRRMKESKKNILEGGDQWQEAGIWLLLPLCLLGALAFRRGWLLTLPLLLLFSAQAQAFNWGDLWRTQDQQASHAFARQEFSRAAEQFSNRRWKAAALYRAGEFAASAELLKDSGSADDYYNRGNALVMMGALSEALVAYQQALLANPEHADALHNKNLIEATIQQQSRMQAGMKQRSGGRNPSKSSRASSPQGQPRMMASKKNQPGQPENQSDMTNQSDEAPAAQGATPSSKENDGQRTPSRAKPGMARKGDEAVPNAEGTGGTNSDPDKESKESSEEYETRQLLQQIVDDPGGLLRRKFLYQARQRGAQKGVERPW